MDKISTNSLYSKALILTSLFLISITTLSQDYPDKIYFISGDSIEGKIKMINSQNVFATEKTFTKSGRIKPQERIFPISEIAHISLNSLPTIANRHWDKLLNKYDNKFFELGCQVETLEYDPSAKETVSQIKKPIAYTVGVESAWVGVTIINNKKYLLIAKAGYGDGFSNILAGARIEIVTETNSMLLEVDRNYSSINHQRFVVGNSDFFEAEVIHYTSDNYLEMLIPITNEQLQTLATSSVSCFNIETAVSQMKIKADANLSQVPSEICNCGLHMK